jgi:hypothetical protein
MRAWRLIPVLVLGLASPASAAVEQDRHVATGAGTRVASGTLELEAMIGDIMVGPSAGGTLELWHGFWAPLPGGAVSVPPPGSTAVSFLGSPTPNPGLVTVALRFGLARADRVTLTVHDLAGRAIRTLVAQPLEAGEHSVSWDLRDSGARRVPSGLYFVRLESRDLRAARKVVVP